MILNTIGLHFTISKGFAYAAKTVHSLGGDTFQFFSRNPRGGQAKKYDLEDIELFHKIKADNNMGPILAHAPYTINFASDKESVLSFSKGAVKEDILRMDAVGIEYFNLHPGSHVGSGIEEGIDKIVSGLDECITDDSKITILLETMSGQGSEIGFTFEQLQTIISRVKHPERLGVCMDLCHVFAAGYNVAQDFDGVLNKFDETIGLEKLKTIHLNDSMHEFNSRKDRHEAIGKGEIGLEAIKYIMSHPKVNKLPFYLETRLDDEGHKEEIAMLRKELKNM